MTTDVRTERLHKALGFPVLDKEVPESTQYLTDQTFASLKELSKPTLQAIDEVCMYQFMTKVQFATLPTIMNGKDVLAKAKTGTGKTLAFLLPVVETIVAASDAPAVTALILSPTRELANQIHAEAQHLTKFHRKIRTACFIGGMRISKNTATLDKNTVLDIVVATPGRLLDLLDNDIKGLVHRCSQLKFVILDEADQLLDMGFRAKLESILKFLPTHRQTLLFSATLPESLKDIQRLALKPDHVFIDTIEKAEHDTNEQVVQEYLVCSLQDTITVLECCLKQYMENDRFKIIVFFPTARIAAFMADLFTASHFPIVEMHSRKTQSYRTKTAGYFRENKNVIMFSSDVSARGVDYPGVSNIIQMGLTTNEQYIHRLGRTARAGASGKGLLILARFEAAFLMELKNLPLEEVEGPELARFRSTTKEKIESLLQNETLKLSAERAYQAFLGYYNNNLKRLSLDKVQCVAIATEYAQTIGFVDQVPPLEKKTIGKMGLKGVAGIRIKK